MRPSLRALRLPERMLTPAPTAISIFEDGSAYPVAVCGA